MPLNSLLMILLVFRLGSVSNCQNARVKPPNIQHMHLVELPPESIGVADLNTPAGQSGSSTNKAQPIFELGDV